MENQEPKIITTEDGSHSVYLPNINESYHSSHGAYKESIHVFFFMDWMLGTREIGGSFLSVFLK